MAIFGTASTEPVTTAFLVTFPTNERVRTDLYVAGANFSDYQVRTSDWQFTVRTRQHAWERFREGFITVADYPASG